MTDARSCDHARWALPRTFRPYAIGIAIVLFCLLSLGLKIYIRYGADYLFFGDAASATPTSDARSWNLHAINLAEGRGFGDFTKLFQSRNFVPPGHPFLMSIFYGWFGYRPEWVGWCVALLGALLPWITYLLTSEMFGRRAGWWAAFLCAIYHSFALFGFTLMSEPSTIFSTALALWLWSRICRTQRRCDAALAGFVFGAAALVRPSALAFLFGCSVGTLLIRAPWKRKLQLAGLLLLMAAIMPAAWQVRNRAVHGEQAFVYSSISARQAWTADHPDYRPSFYSRDAWHRTLWEHPHEGELGRIKRLQEETRAFRSAAPLHHAVGILWRLRPLLDLGRPRRHADNSFRWADSTWLHFQTIALLILGAAGLFMSTRTVTRHGTPTAERTTSGVLWTTAFGLALIISIYGTGIYGASPRYRLPLEYAFFPFVGLALFTIQQGARKLWSRPLVVECQHTDRGMACARHTGRIVLLVVIGVLTIHSGHLVLQRRRALRTPPHVATLKRSDVMAGIRACHLAKAFQQQEPRWVTRQAFIDEMKANHGALTTLNEHIVVWNARIIFPEYDAKGNLNKAYAVIDPAPDSFGMQKFPLRPARGRHTGNWKVEYGDLVTLIARIDLSPQGRPAVPYLRVSGILPGLHELP